ncbi:MAG: hypothetical protein AB4372_25095 [Xenococcus sp. (in: cyanobacteria)]
MNTETRWEGAVLEKLTSNGERIAVLENKLDNLTEDVKELKEDVKDIKLALGWLKWIGGAVVTIALALVANGISSLIF